MTDSGVILYDNTLKPYPNLYGFSAPKFTSQVNFSTVDVSNSEPETAQTTLEKTPTRNSKNVIVEIGDINPPDYVATMDLKKQKQLDRDSERENQKVVMAMEVDNIKHGQACVMGFGISFLILALISALVAFGTPDWRIYTVNPNKADKNSVLYICDPNNPSISTCPFYASRRRGLFTTCYSDQSLLQFFPQNVIASPWVTGDWCVWEQKYNLQSSPLKIDDNCGQDANFKNSQLMVMINANLMRTQWLAFAIAILMLFLAIVFALMSQCEIRVCGSLLAAVMTLISTFLLIVGMAFFHGYTYMEEEVLRCPPFYATIKKDIYKTLYQGTDISFGFSFFLGWLSVGLDILATCFLMVGGCQRRESQKKIDKAEERLVQIAKEEKAEKKVEEIESKRRRKEQERKLKKEEKNMNSRRGQDQSRPRSFFANLLPSISARAKQELSNFSDSEINYNSKNKLEDSRLKYEKKIREQKKTFNEWEEEQEAKFEEMKKKFWNKKERELDDLEKGAKDSIRVDRNKSKVKTRKPAKEKRQSKDSSSDSQSDSDDDNYYRNRSSYNRRYSFDNIKKWNPQCGKIIGTGPFMQHNSCCDPFTLHLPTGMAPAYYP
ncbi:hypothetical protein HELRODRAFT_158735 [Helobdella robusta]|uniref:Uncharacterized protein n=1 Tax=Helobdella robusta TaxID=6412 RepID=T1EN64_HELRO|nr:hypothetical protein HELRODRAFT_158735 [Helobdella robusta]ESO12257.1 hypothetical protein HELRODRAFT_158735 [Helobdella robusta]